jgi:hypothetical protein
MKMWPLSFRLLRMLGFTPKGLAWLPACSIGALAPWVKASIRSARKPQLAVERYTDGAGGATQYFRDFPGL